MWCDYASMTLNKDGTPRKKRTNLPSIMPISLADLIAQLPVTSNVMVSRKWVEALNLFVATDQIKIAAKAKEADPELDKEEAAEKIAAQSFDLSDLLDWHDPNIRLKYYPYENNILQKHDRARKREEETFFLYRQLQKKRTHCSYIV